MSTQPQEGLYRIIEGHVSYSQAHQDLFVRKMLDFKSGGSYLEIGAADPVESNNTYILERDLGWKGISLDIEPTIVQRFNEVRRNPCVCADATSTDYSPLLEQLATDSRVDYLSLDIDPASITYKALLHLPLDRYRFSVITYEHDAYLSGHECMKLAREHLASHGYVRVVSNVMVVGRDFEDWWVDPVAVPETTWGAYEASAIECANIFKGKL